MREIGMLLLLLTCGVALCSCKTVSPAPITCPKLAPAPAWVMEKQNPDFSSKMQNFLFQKPDGQTGS